LREDPIVIKDNGIPDLQLWQALPI